MAESALAQAHARIGELETALAQVNGRLAEATTRADLADQQIAVLTARLRVATVAAREADARFHRLASPAPATGNL